MKLLEIKTTYTNALKIAKDKNLKLLSKTKNDLDKLDVSFLKPRIGSNGILKVWVGNESREVEKGVNVADLAVIELVGYSVFIEVIESNVLFLNRAIMV